MKFRGWTIAYSQCKDVDTNSPWAVKTEVQTLLHKLKIFQLQKFVYILKVYVFNSYMYRDKKSNWSSQEVLRSLRVGPVTHSSTANVCRLVVWRLNGCSTKSCVWIKQGKKYVCNDLTFKTVMDWWPVQGITHLSPKTRWDISKDSLHGSRLLNDYLWLFQCFK